MWTWGGESVFVHVCSVTGVVGCVRYVNAYVCMYVHPFSMLCVVDVGGRVYIYVHGYVHPCLCCVSLTKPFYRHTLYIPPSIGSPTPTGSLSVPVAVASLH